MPNTKSAEKRTRSSARKHDRNQIIRSQVRNVERKFRKLVADGKKDEAGAALGATFSTLDKASKRGVIHWATVDRKKSRLAALVATK